MTVKVDGYTPGEIVTHVYKTKKGERKKQVQTKRVVWRDTNWKYPAEKIREINKTKVFEEKST